MGPSFLDNPPQPLILDASVVINLNACGFASNILRAIPHSILVADAVVEELRSAPRGQRDDATMLGQLMDQGLIDEVSLDELRQDYFESLVLGNDTNTLDDGEAATIAYAVDKHAIAVIDERKANRICKARFPKLPVASTVDIFQIETVAKSLGPGPLSDAVFNALTIGRMRVLPEHTSWVVSLVGRARVVNCLSLPAHVRAGAHKIPS